MHNQTLYGTQTALAEENFRLNGRKTNPALIFAIVTVKKAAAQTYQKLLPEKKELYAAMEKACNLVLSCEKEYDEGKSLSECKLENLPFTEVFVTEALQGGAGTSTHMNVNEVLAALTGKLLKLEYQKAMQEDGERVDGSEAKVHPLDDMNRGQSTNDVYPTALRIAAIKELRKLSEACAKLQTALQEKENEFDHIAKLGRTELMDAVPITLGAEFGAYAQAVARDRWRLYKVEERLRQTNLGGTAVGGGDNTSHKYQAMVIEQLREITGIGLARAEYPMDMTQNNDVFVEVSGLLKASAVNLMKIAEDFRLMNSGPKGGFGEIILPKVQAGSTIMPGKANPVMAEMMMQVSMRVLANDTAISMAAAHGEFELNAFLPLIADSLLESLQLLTNGIHLFRTRCVEKITANEKQCGKLLEMSCAFATEYTKKLGYDRVAKEMAECGNDAGKLRKRLEELTKNK